MKKNTRDKHDLLIGDSGDFNLGLEYLVPKKKFSFSVNGSNPYREIADLTNRLWGEGNGGIKVNEKHVSSLLRHCSDEKLTMLNFLPSDLERYCQKCLKLDI